MNTFIQIVIDSLSFGGLYALFALGIALIFGVMDLVNFAYGEFIMVGAYVLYFLRGHPWPLLLAGCVVAVMLFALLAERIAFRPVRGASPSTLLVTSFALSYLIQNLAILLFSSRPKAVNISTRLILPVRIGAYAIP